MSEGRHDHGGGEVDDVRAALDWLDNEFHLPLIFCGFSFVEIAAMRNISERTVQRNWEKARIYLHRKIRPDLSL